MRSQGAASTADGNKRSTNEDSFLIDNQLGLYVVCDGSQSKGGKWAAEAGCSKIQEFLKKNIKTINAYNQSPTALIRTQLETAVADAIQYACQLIYDEVNKDPDKSGAITTSCVLLVLTDSAIIANVGNSRIYHLRENKALLLTKDHTKYFEMLESHTWPPEKINPSYKKHLTHAMGSSASIVTKPFSIVISQNDKFLLCTDGLSDYIPHATGGLDLEKLSFLKTEPAEKAAQSLVHFSLKQGTKDNTTAVLIQIGRNSNNNENTILHKSLQQQINIIKNLPIFDMLKDDDLAILKIQSLITTRKVNKSGVIVQQNDFSDEMFFIVQGSVSVLVNGKSVSTLKAGDAVGEMGFFVEDLRSATVVADVDCEISSIKKVDFYALMQKNPDLDRKVLRGAIQEISKKLKALSAKMANSSAN